ncbi:olfactory receptor 5V1-like [Pleurodeles waltl]|uniref:olfactory receptor 5V1-like n=1 Tax=Pleurodeles waltl TaxID=8319 RepID=UPI003709BD82
MKGINQSLASEFIIVGFYDFPHLLVPLFVSFLLIYLLILVGNLLIMVVVYSNKQLHTPMYFFLTNLAFLDISYTTMFFPNMLSHFFLEVTHISLNGCLLQMFFFVFMVSTEFFLLAVMAYDRYVAICNPLRYITTMNDVVCMKLAAGCWLLSLIDPIPHIVLTSRLSFCGSHTIYHFFCDVAAVLNLSCSGARAVQTASYVMGTIVGVAPFALTITSYINIISTILKIRSAEGRRKAFSTCASHLTVVVLFYGVICSTYMRPPSTVSVKYNKLLSLLYVALTPLCNPIIYCLKNTEFKNNLMKTKNIKQHSRNKKTDF